MALTTVFGSVGFIARFIIAFVIIAYLFTQQKGDKALRRGFVILCALGVAVFVIGFLLIFGVFAFSGMSFMGDALTNFHFNNFFW